jgi:hypothetical protein
MIKKFSDFDKINESAPIAELESAFQHTSAYADARAKVKAITDELEFKFHDFCEQNGHPGAEGDNDCEMTFNNILMELVSRY